MSLTDAEVAESIHELALANYKRAEAASVLALAPHSIVPKPPPAVPVPHVVGEPQPDPLHVLLTPWYKRVVTPEPSADAAEARDRLRAAIAERSTAATALQVAEDALDRADTLIAEIEADLEARAERVDARATNLADSIRAWITSGSVGERASPSQRVELVQNYPPPRPSARVSPPRSRPPPPPTISPLRRSNRASALSSRPPARCLPPGSTRR
jgi:hypothetical protein